ncbi:MAG: histidine--tRNA ligase [Candidatus Omnitrophica bacterium]|nr:histidine--tRNA ligase [Candidatus Omnitrophota bacterium]
MYKRVAGTKDILPQEIALWQRIEDTARRIFSLYNYKECRPPLIEELSLFNRSLGEGTEIVQKQMFVIHNKDESYALRPEGTASIVRCYIENNLDKISGFQKLFYIGPMFRLERPQKGRLRQFHHIGCEVIGSREASLDVEILALADKLLKDFGIEGYEIKLNSLGCLEDKFKLSDFLRKELKSKISGLCADCQRRFDGNILRILDCKVDACREAVKNISLHDQHLCADCKTHFSRVRVGLDTLKIKYALTPLLVRGLDYYTGTVFEITHPDLGSQDSIGAGGRYNNLVKELGGPDVGAIGFAFGVERLLLTIKPKEETTTKNLTFIITLGEKAKSYGIKLLNELRSQGITADTDYEGKSLKGAMRTANDLNAKFALIIGEDELNNGSVTIKNMVTSEQKEVKSDDLKRELIC